MTNAEPMRTIALRLQPGLDVRQHLEDWAKKESIRAAVILGAVGSLSNVCLRFAGQESHTELAGKHEILTLSGMLSEAGVHLHASVSDAEGKCTGGHVVYGCEVYTTLEVAIALLPSVQFHRTFDPATGFKELSVQNKPLD